MSKTNKHKPPLKCYVRRWLVGVSQSAIFARCTLGLHHECAACSGCERNIRETMVEAFQEGLKAGMSEASEAARKMGASVASLQKQLEQMQKEGAHG